MKQINIISKYPKAWNDFWNDPAKYIPIGVGESYEKFKNRVTHVLENITNSNKNIMIVTHSNIKVRELANSYLFNFLK